MITYDSFVEKYPQFITKVDSDRFALFLADALLEIERVNWGTLKDRGTELLTAHLITVSAPGDRSAIPLKRFNVLDDEYEVEYSDRGSDYSGSEYGIEYERLLKFVTGQTPESIPTSTARGNTFQAPRKGAIDW